MPDDIPMLLGAFLGISLLLADLALRSKRRQTRSAADRIVSEFGLRPGEFQVLGADIGGYDKTLDLRADGVHGQPDAGFISSDKATVVIGEAKSRTYRGRITDYERYQLTLYLGAVAKRYPRADVRGVFRYANRVVPMAFDPELYAWLISLVPEFHKRKKALRSF